MYSLYILHSMKTIDLFDCFNKLSSIIYIYIYIVSFDLLIDCLDYQMVFYY